MQNGLRCFRGANTSIVIPAGISAAEAGFPIAWRELEGAYLQGIDVDTASTAYVTAQKRGQDLTFEEIVDAARESRLKKLLDL